MIEETIKKLEAAVQGLEPKKKAELSGLLATLQEDLLEVRKERDAQVADLTRAIQELEISHPILVKAIDAICRDLASLGI